jgi:exosortase
MQNEKFRVFRNGELSVEWPKRMIEHINRRNSIFLLLTITAVGMVYTPLRDLLTTAERSEYYSHILLIPLVSGFFLYTGRKAIFANLKYSYTIGMPLVIIGVLLYVLGWYQRHQLNQNDYSSLMTFSAIIFWVGAFVLSYGMHSFQKGMFPILFLVLMVPIPSILLDEIIFLLQIGSTEATAFLFRITGMPFLREGFAFDLPGIGIEVSRECSGIRSSLGLFITGILGCHLFLRTRWKKFILLLAVFPITVLKNGIRIVTLSSFAVYVDEKFITQSFLHRSGGFIFYIPALFLLGLILWWLRKSEVTPGKEDL